MACLFSYCVSIRVDGFASGSSSARNDFLMHICEVFYKRNM